MTRFSAFLLAMLVVLSVPALGADMTFFMKNRQDRGVAVELFSQDRAISWPGGNKVYFLDVGERKSMTVSCQEGERICYGAWVNGDDSRWFGVGPDNDQPPCTYCCFICVGQTTATISVSK